MPKLTTDEQRALISRRLSDTINSSDSELRGDREQALNFYYGRPLGNELPGRSQVVSKDLMDTIEWRMPSLMRIFCTRDAVQFDAVGPDDEEQAKQETQYVNHILWKKNPGFMLIYNWLKDGLMQKVGYVKTWWEKEQKAKYENYTGLSDEAVMMLMQELEESAAEVEVLGQEQDEQGMWSLRLKVVREYGCIKIMGVQPDEMIVDKDCKGSVREAKFTAHLRNDLTRGDVVEMGYKKELVKQLTDYTWNQTKNAENQARDSVNENSDPEVDDETEWASQRIRLLECYTYLDVDQDGIAELRHYLMDGSNEPLINEEFDEIPFDSWTPIPIPHRHIGLSEYDRMEDQQRIQTALQRGLLDNIYFNNNNRKAYNKNTVDVDSLVINRPGGHIGVDGSPMTEIMDLQINPMAQMILPVIAYFDEVRERRTGVGKNTSGLDPDVLSHSTKGAFMAAQSSANQQTEAIARIFAETGLSSLFTSIHRLAIKHQDAPDRFKVLNKWVSVNPSEWSERSNLTAAVGLGNSSREETRANLGLIAQAQMQAAQAPGLIQPQNVYALFSRMQSELGFENQPFITDPGSPEYKKFQESQKPQPDPYVEVEKLKAQMRMQEKKIEDLWNRDKLASDTALEITDMELKYGTDLAKAGIGAEVAVQRGAQAASRGGQPAAREPAATGSPAGQ